MAPNPQKSLKNLNPILCFLIIISLSSTSASARPLHDYLLQSLAATEPALNLALPSDNFSDAPVISNPTTEKDSNHNFLPCDHDMETGKDSGVKTGSARLTGKYGPMVLNMLLKGPIPPSGPSKGTNSNNN